jgi:hypothetical protein
MAKKSNNSVAGSRKEIELLATKVRKEWSELSRILRELSVCADTGPLDSPVYGLDTYGCFLEMTNLVLRFSPAALKCLPSNLEELDCRLSARVGLPYGLSDDDICKDPLSNLSVEIELRGMTSTGEFLIHCWHLDRHPEYPAGKKGEIGISAAHPRYHFHFGGRRIKQFAGEMGLDSLGAIMLFDGPRLPHPPLDAVLAVDMLFSNFSPLAWTKLRESADYVRLIAISQKRLWRPYARSLVSHWGEDGNKSGWLATDPWPHLL